jgi:N-acetylmuramoyl-L-alanine amidase
MPSVLVELGFLTNDTEGPYINSKRGRSDMAKEIAKGILAYKKQISLATEDFKNPVITDEEKDDAIKNTAEKIYKGITFKVQLAATGKKLNPNSRNFKGLKDVSRDKENGLYKYYYGETSDYNKIQLMKTFAQQKGFPTAYVVAFKKGKKLNISEVLKSKDN